MKQIILFVFILLLSFFGCSQKTTRINNESKDDLDVYNNIEKDSDSYSKNDSGNDSDVSDGEIDENDYQDSEIGDPDSENNYPDSEKDDEKSDDLIPATCGNNEIDTGEICDGNIVNCIEIDSDRFISGKALCLDDCSGYDTETCVEKSTETICTPGERKCDENKVLECIQSGMEFAEIEICEGDKPFCDKGDCLDECEVAGNNKSDTGCEFWGAFLQQGGGYESDANYAIIISNPNDTEIIVKIYISGDEVIKEQSVPAFETVPIDLGTERRVSDPGICDLGFKIVSSRPVSVIQMNPFGDVLVYSNDASLLIPKGSLSGEYYAMSWPGWSTLPGFISVIAVDDGETSIELTYGGDSVAGKEVDAETSGAKKTYILNQYQILTVNSTDGESDSYGSDLTGTYIKADKKIAVFGGHVCSRIPADKNACDHLEHQIFPLMSWGTNYVAVRTTPRNDEDDYYKILASSDGTVAVITGGVTDSIELSAGQAHLFSTKKDFIVDSNHPVLVGHFLASQDADAGTGDPSMMLLVPTRQMRTEHMFIVPENYSVNNVTIVAPGDTEITFNEETTYDSDSFEKIEGTNWYKHYLSLDAGGYKMTSSKPSGIYIYGNSNYVSYAFTGGMNFTDD